MPRVGREDPVDTIKVPGSSSWEKDQNSTGDHGGKMTVVWVNVVIMIYLHVGGLIGLYYWVTLQCYWQTILLGKLCSVLTVTVY